MTEESKYKVYTEFRGQYVIINDKRLWTIGFPNDSTLEENLEVIAEIEKGIRSAIEQVKEKEKKKSEEITEVK